MTAPERSLKQRRDALKTANEVRVKRAVLKRDIGGGRQKAEDIIANPPDYALTMTLWDLMMAMPKCGRVKTNKLLTTCRISPSKTLGGLSTRQRADIRSLLGRGIGDPVAALRYEAKKAADRAYREGPGRANAEYRARIAERHAAAIQ